MVVQTLITIGSIAAETVDANNAVAATAIEAPFIVMYGQQNQYDGVKGDKGLV